MTLHWSPVDLEIPGIVLVIECGLEADAKNLEEGRTEAGRSLTICSEEWGPLRVGLAVIPHDSNNGDSVRGYEPWLFLLQCSATL